MLLQNMKHSGILKKNKNTTNLLTFLKTNYFSYKGKKPGKKSPGVAIT